MSSCRRPDWGTRGGQYGAESTTGTSKMNRWATTTTTTRRDDVFLVPKSTVKTTTNTHTGWARGLWFASTPFITKTKTVRGDGGDKSHH